IFITSLVLTMPTKETKKMFNYRLSLTGEKIPHKYKYCTYKLTYNLQWNENVTVVARNQTRSNKSKPVEPVLGN
ncbi:hypothetical protein L9F63_001526, partial [Diploptera punctata]